MYTILWFDHKFKEGRLRLINGMDNLAFAKLHADRVVDGGLSYEIVETVDLDLSDRTFRNAWVMDEPSYKNRVKVDMPKAIEIAHYIRRDNREKEFAPFDEIIMKNIPGVNLSAAEDEREKIRKKYVAIQTDVDKATTPAELKGLIL